MKKLARLALFVVLAVSPLLAESPRVELYEGTVSFVAPEGFSRMADDVVAVKFPNAQPGTIVYGNERATVSISITHPPQRVLTAEELPQFKAFMESLLETQSKGLKWVKKEIVDLGGRKWIHFEFTTPAIDTTIHNDIYMTSRDGRMLAFNFNSSAEHHEANKEALEKSRGTILLK